MWEIVKKFYKLFLTLIYSPGGKGVAQDQSNRPGVCQSLEAALVGNTYLLSGQLYPGGEAVTKELAFGGVETVEETNRVINLNTLYIYFIDFREGRWREKETWMMTENY